MSDSSIPSDQSTHTDTVELRQAEERLQARFQEQSEWYRLRRLRGETSLCDCSNCINARERKSSEVGESARRPPDIPKQSDIIQGKITDIRSLFRFLLPSDEAIYIASIFSSN